MRTGLIALGAVVARGGSHARCGHPAAADAATCAKTHASRTAPPIQVYDPQPGAPRVFAMQFKQALRNVETYQAFRDKIELPDREIVFPARVRAPERGRLQRGHRPDDGRHRLARAQARALFANRGWRQAASRRALRAERLRARHAHTSYAPQLAAYHARFPR